MKKEGQIVQKKWKVIEKIEKGTKKEKIHISIILLQETTKKEKEIMKIMILVIEKDFVTIIKFKK